MSNGKYSIFKVNNDFIVAESEEKAVVHYLTLEGLLPKVEVIPPNQIGKFDREDGQGQEEMTYGEWLAGFTYTGPQLISWNE